MGFLSRFRRSAKTLDDIGSIASEEDLPFISESRNMTHEMEPVLSQNMKWKANGNQRK